MYLGEIALGDLVSKYQAGKKKVMPSGGVVL